MLKTIEIDTYVTQEDHLGVITEAGRLESELHEEIQRAGFKGIPPLDQTSGLSIKAWSSSLVEHALVHGGGIRKGTTVFVWK